MCLVVDDDTAVSDALATGLRAFCGAAVLCVSDGRSAAHVLQTRHIDFAAIDVILPDISGFELADLAANRNVPAVLMSGHPERQMSCKYHGYPHLDKPFPLAVLADAATHAVRNPAGNIACLRQAYASLMATLGADGSTMTGSGHGVSESKTLRAERAAAHERRRRNGLAIPPEKTGAPRVQSVAAMGNVLDHQHLLQTGGNNEADGHTKRMVRQLLIEEDAKLAAFDQQTTRFG